MIAGWNDYGVGNSYGVGYSTDGGKTWLVAIAWTGNGPVSQDVFAAALKP